MKTSKEFESEPESKVIGNNLKNLMKNKSVSESQLSRDLNISVMTIRRVISGETGDPRISTLKLIADYFNVGIDELLNSKPSFDNMIDNTNVIAVPILEWDELDSFYQSPDAFDKTKCSKWQTIAHAENLNLGSNAFALQSKSSMHPFFPKNTSLIVKPFEDPIDNDIILIKDKNNNTFSFKELVMDTPKWILQPVIEGSERIFYNQKHYDIVGVVLLTMLQKRM